MEEEQAVYSFKQDSTGSEGECVPAEVKKVFRSRAAW